jgi:hypothetical protein
MPGRGPAVEKHCSSNVLGAGGPPSVRHLPQGVNEVILFVQFHNTVTAD